MERTLSRLRELGHPHDVTERRVGPVRKDLFGLFDVVYLNGRIVGVQVTDSGHRAAHQKSMRENPLLERWVACGGTYELWVWRKVKEKRKGGVYVWDLEVTGL